jgi:hypothetical protein
MVGLFDSFQSTSTINGLCSNDFFTPSLFYLPGAMAINLVSKSTGSKKSKNSFLLINSKYFNLLPFPKYMERRRNGTVVFTVYWANTF